MIEIVAAPPFATVQDLGFPGGRAWGLPPGGAMDPTRLGMANTLVGNPPGAAAIEWTLGPLEIRFPVKTKVAALGVGELQLGDRRLDPAEPVFTAPARSVLRCIPASGLRFSYVALAGGIAVPEVLGSRSTYLPGGFGGFAGRRLQVGDRLPLGRAAGPGFGLTLSRSTGSEPPPGELTIRATAGPQWERFDETARRTFFSARYTVSTAADRMGYRLDGPAVAPQGSATLASEAVCVGAVQIPDGGQPIVVMPDGPTVGGYPKLAVVLQADLGMLAQCRPGQEIRFRAVSLEAARACYSLDR